MNTQTIRDKKKRLNFAKIEKKQIKYKIIINNHTLPEYIRWNTYKKLINLPKKNYKNRIKNRCIITGRSKSIYKHFKISRITLREFASLGLLPGLTKSSW